MSKSFISLIALCRKPRLWREDSGQDLVEYALLGALIAVVCAGAFTPVTTAVDGLFTAIAGAL